MAAESQDSGAKRGSGAGASRRRASMRRSELALPAALWMVTAQKVFEANVAVGTFTTQGLRQFLELAEHGQLPAEIVPAGSKLLVAWTAVDAIRPQDAPDNEEAWPYMHLHYSFPDIGLPSFSNKQPATLWRLALAAPFTMSAMVFSAQTVMERLLQQETKLRARVRKRQEDAQDVYEALNADTRSVVSQFLRYGRRRLSSTP